MHRSHFLVKPQANHCPACGLLPEAGEEDSHHCSLAGPAKRNTAALAHPHSILPSAEIFLPIPSKKTHTPAAFKEPQRWYTSLPPNHPWIHFHKSREAAG